MVLFYSEIFVQMSQILELSSGGTQAVQKTVSRGRGGEGAGIGDVWVQVHVSGLNGFLLLSVPGADTGQPPRKADTTAAGLAALSPHSRDSFQKSCGSKLPGCLCEQGCSSCWSQIRLLCVDYHTQGQRACLTLLLLFSH